MEKLNHLEYLEVYALPKKMWSSTAVLIYQMGVLGYLSVYFSEPLPLFAYWQFISTLFKDLP